MVKIYLQEEIVDGSSGLYAGEVELTRVPCLGEIVSVKKDNQDLAFKVKAVVHLGYSNADKIDAIVDGSKVPAFGDGSSRVDVNFRRDAE